MDRVEPLPAPATARPGRRAAGARRRDRREWFAAYGLLLPATLILAVFHLFPIVYAVWISTRRWRLVDRGSAGLDNYREALTNGDTWRALANTVYFTLGTVPVELALALVIAYLLFQKVRFLSVLRTLYFLPYVTSTVAAAAVWAWMFDSRNGVFNSVLGWFGLGPLRWLQEPRGVLDLLAAQLSLPWPGWAGGPSLALVAIMLMTIWHYLGFQIVVFLVGLGGIPRELYEAARVDGAGPAALFFRITLPLLAPTILFVAVIATIGSFQSFNQIYQMSSRANVGSRPGGPLHTTETLVILILNEFQSSRLGYGSAVAMLLFVIILALTLLQLRLSRRWARYEGR